MEATLSDPACKLSLSVLQEIENSAHMLAGSAPTFGFRSVGAKAAELEQAMRLARLAGTVVQGQGVERLKDLVLALKEASLAEALRT